MKRSIDDTQKDSNKKKNPIQMRNDSESFIAQIQQRQSNLGDFLRDAQRNILISQTSSSMLLPRDGISCHKREGESFTSSTNDSVRLSDEIVRNLNSVNNISSNVSSAPLLMLNQPQQQLLQVLLNNQKKLLEEREAIEKAASLYDERQRKLAIAALYKSREHLQQQLDRTGIVLNAILASRDLPHAATTSTIPILPNVTSPVISHNELIRLQQSVSATSAITGSNTNIDRILLSIAEHHQQNLSEHTSTSHGSNHDSNSLMMLSQPSHRVKATQTQEVNRSNVNMQLKQPPVHSDIASIPETLPVLLVRPVIDQYKLSDFQYLLRQQIEIFEAGDDEVMTHIRGRNTAIEYGQVGLRCKHCSHVPVAKRQKGSTYFPSNTLAIYQAAQNMATTHIQCGLCEYMPASIKQQFVNILSDRQNKAIRGVSNSIGAGRQYWANSAMEIGLIDTEHGIRFIRSLQSQNYVNK